MSNKHHRYYKHTKFRQNPRGDPKFLVDLTWNDPFLGYTALSSTGKIEAGFWVMLVCGPRLLLCGPYYTVTIVLYDT